MNYHQWMQCGSQHEWKWNEETQKIGGENKTKYFMKSTGEVYLDEGRKLVLWSTFGPTPCLGLESSLKGSFLFSTLSYFCCHPGEHIYKVRIKVHRTWQSHKQAGGNNKCFWKLICLLWGLSSVFYTYSKKLRFLDYIPICSCPPPHTHTQTTPSTLIIMHSLKIHAPPPIPHLMPSLRGLKPN